MIKHAMTTLGLLLAVAFVAAAPARANEGELPSANTRVDNTAAVQRGAKIYFNYCIGCHSLKYMRYARIGEDLNLSEDQVMSQFNRTGAKYGETIQATMAAADAQTWFGKAPPDLSLEARSKGPDWIYNYLKSFYLDPSRPVGWNNTVFPGASMPNVLWELQGAQSAKFEPPSKDEHGKDGCKHGEKELDGRCFAGFEPAGVKGRLSAQEFDEVARDVTAFLQYVGEPAALKREKLGVWVVLYLSLFTLIAYLLKHEYWRDVH